MGESEIEFASTDSTIVLWNTEDYPIPDGVNLLSTRLDIDRALELMGFYGGAIIRVYGGQLKDREIDAVWKAGMSYHAPRRDVDLIEFQLCLDMINCARSQPNFLVIAKQSPEAEFHRVQQCLHSRDRTVLVLVDDTAAQESPFGSVESLVGCTRVLGGGKPIRITRDYWYLDTCDNDKDASSQSDSASDSSKVVEDFSKPLTHIKGRRTLVFWNSVACPLPLGSDADEIYRRIDQALRKSGSEDDTSIWVYVNDENNEYLLRDKTWDSRIYFLPGGASRHHRMLHDMLFWMMDLNTLDDDDADVANLIVVSDKFRDAFFFGKLASLNDHYCCSVCLVTPNQRVNKPERPEWPLPLIQEAYALDYPNGLSSERREPAETPRPIKHKPGNT